MKSNHVILGEHLIVWVLCPMRLGLLEFGVGANWWTCGGRGLCHGQKQEDQLEVSWNYPGETGCELKPGW